MIDPSKTLSYKEIAKLSALMERLFADLNELGCVDAIVTGILPGNELLLYSSKYSTLHKKPAELIHHMMENNFKKPKERLGSNGDGDHGE